MSGVTGSMLSTWVAGARPKTLPAAVVPVAVGTVAGVSDLADIVWWRAGVALLVAAALQVATNFVNDYADGERGTDDARLGPERLVAAGEATVSAVKWAALVAFGVAALAGLVLAVAVGWELLVVGAISIIAGWAYTGGPRPYGYMGLGEVFVFIFFGLVATVGSAYVQVERVEPLVVVAAVPVGLLAVGLLMVNNLRDIPTDKQSGKMTLAVRLGDRITRLGFVGIYGATAVAVLGVALLRPWASIALLGCLAAWLPVSTVRSGAKGAELVGVLEGSALTQLLVGLLLTLGLAL